MSSKVVVVTAIHLAAAQELREIMAQEKVLTERKVQVKKVLAEVLTTAGQSAVDENGEVFATVRDGVRRFDAEEAKRNLPPTAYKMILVEQADASLAKELLPPALYVKCCKQGAPSIVAA